ncbi:MAG: TolC family protein [Porticoccaceae bacterium]
MYLALASVPAVSGRRPCFGYPSRHGYKLAVAILAFGLSGWATAAVTPTDAPLSLAEALHRAEVRSHALAAQDAAATAAGAMAVAARQLPDPVLRLAVENLPIDGADRYSLTDDFMTMRSIGLMQTMTGADKRAARATRFEREGEVAQTAHALERTRLRRDTALAWLDRHYREQMVALLQRQRDETALQIDAAEAAYRAGRGPQAEVFLARAAVAQIEDRIRAAAAERANAATLLARWIGERAFAPLGTAPDIANLRVASDGVEHAADRLPEIALLAKREAVALAEAEVAREERRPDWSVEMMYSQRGPGFSDMVSLAVSVPLPWDQGNRQDRELAAKLALAARMGDEREEMTRQHLADVRRWQQSWRAGLERLAAYDRTLVPVASARTQAALAAYRGASGPLSAVLEARRMEIDICLERLRIEQETAGLWATLEYLLPAEHAAVAAIPSPDPTATPELQP